MYVLIFTFIAFVISTGPGWWTSDWGAASGIPSEEPPAHQVPLELPVPRTHPRCSQGMGHVQPEAEVGRERMEQEGPQRQEGTHTFAIVDGTLTDVVCRCPMMIPEIKLIGIAVWNTFADNISVLRQTTHTHTHIWAPSDNQSDPCASSFTNCICFLPTARFPERFRPFQAASR